MKLIDNILDIDLKATTGEHLLVNALNGLCDVIQKQEYEIFCKWNNSGLISANTETEHKLYNILEARGYLVSKDYNEELVREELLHKLKEKSNLRLQKNDCAAFIITYGCNFACPYCYEQGIDNKKIMSNEQIDKVFELHCNSIKHIGFFGGEPLLPGNKDRIEYIISKAPNATFSVITNGYYLLDYFDVFKEISVSNIQVTIDGTKEMHDRTRILKNGNPTFDRIMKGVQLFAEHGIPLTIRMNASKENIVSCIAEKERLFAEKWASNIKFEMQPVFQCKDVSLYGDVLAADMDSKHKNTMLSRQGPLVNFLYTGKPLMPIIKACEADYKFRFYDPYGDIYSCILAVGRKNRRIGTYFPELVYDESNMLERDICTIPQCRTCKYALFCGGGCANSLPDNCNILTTPNCASMNKEINHIIPMVYNMKKARI